MNDVLNRLITDTRKLGDLSAEIETIQRRNPKQGQPLLAARENLRVARDQLAARVGSQVVEGQ